jgi:hypothetical protein
VVRALDEFAGDPGALISLMFADQFAVPWQLSRRSARVTVPHLQADEADGISRELSAWLRALEGQSRAATSASRGAVGLDTMPAWLFSGSASDPVDCNTERRRNRC